MPFTNNSFTPIITYDWHEVRRGACLTLNKQTKNFLKNYALKNAPMLPMSRIGPASQIYVTGLNRIESLNNLMKIKLTIFSSQKTRPRHYKIAHNGVR